MNSKVYKQLLAIIGLLLALLDGSPFAWLALIKAICDAFVLLQGLLKEEYQMKTVFVTVGTGVSGVAKT